MLRLSVHACTHMRARTCECTCGMHMRDAHAGCTCGMHTRDAHAGCVAAVRCGIVNPAHRHAEYSDRHLRLLRVSLAHWVGTGGPAGTTMNRGATLTLEAYP